MGARATITIYQYGDEADETPLNLYTHWGGHEICQTLAEGLRKAKEAGRLTDPPYATRIIFDTLTGLEGGDTGYGIIVGDHDDINYDSPVIVWPKDGYGTPMVRYNELECTAQAWIDLFVRSNSDGVSIVV